ncbi:MAG: hypothetical protein EKK48_12110 [Candidatus Melainabacteria bacterium]|nr:MAG: hypothetical protein EKK48_12110 [Candidatus Melainabacteria bacterium]
MGVRILASFGRPLPEKPKSRDELKAEIQKLNGDLVATRNVLSCVKTKNERLEKEIAELTDPDRISVDHSYWLEVQRKIKKLGWLWGML